MRHIAGRIGLAVLMALLVIGPAGAQEETPEIPDGPYISVFIAETDGPAPGAEVKEGDRCALSWEPANTFFTYMPYQLVMRDGSDQVISVTTIEPTWTQLGSSGGLDCIYDTLIPLPESEYYQVFLNDQYLVTYTPETLPTDPDKGLYLSIGGL